MSSSPVGFVGLGVMGSRMATRLVQAGHALIVHDRDDAAMEQLAALGASKVGNAAALASKASIVFCSLPTPEIVKSVILGADGLSAGTAVKIIVDLSTTGPIASRQVAAALAERDIAFLDAPVSGGAPSAEAGSLTLMISGPHYALTQAEPLLASIGRNLFHVGEDAGLGQTMKLVNNLLFAANAISAFEVLAMGAKAGLDAQVMIDIVNASSGRSFITTDRIPQTVLPRTFPQRFATELLHKDVKLGIDAAESLGAPLHMLHAARAFLSFAMSQGDGPRDCAEMIKHFERWNGVTLGKDSPDQ